MKDKDNAFARFIYNLTLLFIGLKLTGYIDWSWWLVISPIWIAIVIAVLVMVLSVGWVMHRRSSKQQDAQTD